MLAKLYRSYTAAWWWVIAFAAPVIVLQFTVFAAADWLRPRDAVLAALEQARPGEVRFFLFAGSQEEPEARPGAPVSENRVRGYVVFPSVFRDGRLHEFDEATGRATALSDIPGAGLAWFASYLCCVGICIFVTPRKIKHLLALRAAASASP